MAWTAEDRRKYAPAIQEVLRQGMLVRLAATIDTIDAPRDRAPAGLVDRDHARGAVAPGARRLRLAAAAGRSLPAAAPERVEPVPAPAAAGGARPGSRGPGHLPPSRRRAE